MCGATDLNRKRRQSALCHPDNLEPAQLCGWQARFRKTYSLSDQKFRCTKLHIGLEECEPSQHPALVGAAAVAVGVGQEVKGEIDKAEFSGISEEDKRQEEHDTGTQHQEMERKQPAERVQEEARRRCRQDPEGCDEQESNDSIYI